MTKNPILPLEQLAAKRAELWARGVNLREWCQERSISYQAALDVLHGRGRGNRGEAHRAAVALGLKVQPKQEKST